MPASPWRANPLICKHILPSVNVVQRGCHGKACDVEVSESPKLDDTAGRESTARFVVTVQGVSAMLLQSWISHDALIPQS